MAFLPSMKTWDFPRPFPVGTYASEQELTKKQLTPKASQAPSNPTKHTHTHSHSLGVEV